MAREVEGTEEQPVLSVNAIEGNEGTQTIRVLGYHKNR